MAKKKNTPSDIEIGLAQLKKAMGLDEDDNSITIGDQYESITEVVSTGVPELDRIMTPLLFSQTGTGGLPIGFVLELFGPHAGGKSSLAMKLTGQIHASGGNTAWFDVECSYVPEWAAKHGVQKNHLLIIDNKKGYSGEWFLKAVAEAALTKRFRLIVIDSLTALQPEEIQSAELTKEARVGAVAKMMSRAMPKLVTAARQGNCSIIFINQIRQKVGVFYGNPETTPGGEALKFYSSLRLRLAQVAGKNDRGIMREGEEIGIRTNVQVVKSRFGPPYRETIMPIYYDDAKPHPLDLILDAALSNKVIRSRSKKQENSGGEIIVTFTYDSPQYGQTKADGLDEFKKLLEGKHIVEIAERLSKEFKVAFDIETNEYLKTQTTAIEGGEGEEDEEEDGSEDMPPEGDPGA
jgi:recombination protein RecA